MNGIYISRALLRGPSGSQKNTGLQESWHHTGQIIATSAEVTPNGGLVRESPQNPP